MCTDRKFYEKSHDNWTWPSVWCTVERRPTASGVASSSLRGAGSGGGRAARGPAAGSGLLSPGSWNQNHDPAWTVHRELARPCSGRRAEPDVGEHRYIAVEGGNVTEHSMPFPRYRQYCYNVHSLSCTKIFCHDKAEHPVHFDINVCMDCYNLHVYVVL